MKSIGIGLIGSGYMGKRHTVAMQSVGAVFNTPLRPVCEMLCTTTEAGAKQKAQALGFRRSTSDWRVLVADPKVAAIVIASPQETHREIALAAFALGKPVLCEKPLGASLQDAEEMVKQAQLTQSVNMVGFNYIRTPATQFAKKLISEGAIGDITYMRAEHTEDFFLDPSAISSWRARGRANGTMGDLAPHMVNAALFLLGPISELSAQIDHVHQRRLEQSRVSTDDQQVPINDDQGQFLCKFANGASGHLHFSRVATGRKMGFAYEVTGTKGALRFDQEDQNALWLYQTQAANSSAGTQGFRKILTNEWHPDYAMFCEGPGHGTGYQDQLIIEARDFLQAIETGATKWPTFKDALQVSKIIDAAWRSHETRQWVEIA
jgi:predicted dehydrogenase